jgi:hypothetical protein
MKIQRKSNGNIIERNNRESIRKYKEKHEGANETDAADPLRGWCRKLFEHTCGWPEETSTDESHAEMHGRAKHTQRKHQGMNLDCPLEQVASTGQTKGNRTQKTIRSRFLRK